MLEKEFKYYIDNQDTLVKKYNGKTIVIVNEQVMGSYDSTQEAYLASMGEFEPDTFLIMECTAGAGHYTITQRSRVLATV